MRRLEPIDRRRPETQQEAAGGARCSRYGRRKEWEVCVQMVNGARSSGLMKKRRVCVCVCVCVKTLLCKSSCQAISGVSMGSTREADRENEASVHEISA